MPEQDPAKLVHAFMEKHDPKYMADDATFRDYTMPEALQGRNPIGQFLDMFYHTAFPDASAEIRHVISDGEKVAIEFTFRGTNTGNLMGIPATKRSVEIPMCAIYEVSNGVIQTTRLYYDSGLLTRQLGLAPATAV